MMARLFGRQTRKQEQRHELLSAYLDGQLSAGEQARLEAQLSSDPALQAELEELRHTVALVRDLPSVAIPRNFILPQAAVTRPRRALRAKPQSKAWAAPWLTAATAVVSLLFVVVLAGDLFFSGAGRLAFAPAAAPGVEAPQEALDYGKAANAGDEEGMDSRAEPTAAPLPAPAEVLLEESPGAASGAERYGVEAPEHEEVPAPPMEEQVAKEATARAPADVAVEAERSLRVLTTTATPEGMEATVSALGGGSAEEPAGPALTVTSPVAEEATPAFTAVITVTVVPEETGGDAEPTPAEVAEVWLPLVGEGDREAAREERGTLAGEAARLTPALPWRALEVILGLTATALALATVWAWRVRRR